MACVLHCITSEQSFWGGTSFPYWGMTGVSEILGFYHKLWISWISSTQLGDNSDIPVMLLFLLEKFLYARLWRLTRIFLFHGVNTFWKWPWPSTICGEYNDTVLIWFLSIVGSTMILWIPSQWRQALSIRVFFSQAHIQHLTRNTAKVSRDLSYSSNPIFCLLGWPNLKICIPTENLKTCGHDQLPSALTYIFLRTQLKDSA